MAYAKNIIFSFALLALFAGTLSAADTRTASISLSPGWNMISSPFYYQDMDASGCEFSGNFYSYMTRSNEYAKTKTINSESGFWVYSRNSCALKFTSNQEDLVNENKLLYTGWNQVGQPFLSESASVNFADVIGTCDGKVISGPWAYDASIKNYTKASTLSQGKGVWIKVSSDCSLKSLSPPPPPPTNETNRAPVIQSVGGQTSVRVGDSNTWSISAYDPDGNYLFYGVVWGDEQPRMPARNPSSYVSTATFTHVYYAPGTYTITFTVKDASGASTQSTLTVVATSGTTEQPDTQVASGTLDVGQILDAGEIKAMLSSGERAPILPQAASIQIQNANGVPLTTATVAPKTYYKYTAVSGKTYLFYIEEIGAGYTMNAKWAKMRIYRVNGVPDSLSAIQAADDINPSPDYGSPSDTQAKYGIVNVGQVLDSGDFRLQLDDLFSSGYPSSGALVSIQDANGAVLKKMGISEGSFRIMKMPGGTVYAIYVLEAAPGYTLNAKWAAIKIYRVQGTPDQPSYRLEYAGRGTNVATNGTLAIGQSLQVSQGAVNYFQVKLEDLSIFPAGTSEAGKPAIISILDANDVVVAQRVVPVGIGMRYDSPAGTKFIVYTEATNAGFASGSKWAKFTVYSSAASTLVPDLAVDSIRTEGTDTILDGKRLVNVNAIVKNVGTATSSGFDMTFYIDGQWQGGGQGFSPLAPGAVRDNTGGGRYLSSGWHSARFVITNYGADSNTANNELTKQFYVEPVPVVNKAPVISSTGGPTSINVNQQGTWSISAYDPDGNYLSYSVLWGDEAIKGTAKQVFSAATFQHTYTQAGTYTITYTVTDDKGASTQATLTVKVNQPVQPADTKRVTILSPTSGATLVRGQNYTIIWSYSPDMANYLYYIDAMGSSGEPSGVYENFELNTISKGSYVWTPNLPVGTYTLRIGIQPKGAAPLFDGPTVNIVNPIPPAT